MPSARQAAVSIGGSVSRAIDSITSRRSSRGAEPVDGVTVGVVAPRAGGRRWRCRSRRVVVGSAAVVAGRRSSWWSVTAAVVTVAGSVPGGGGEAAEAADGDDAGDGRADGQAADAVDGAVAIGGAAGRCGRS